MGATVKHCSRVAQDPTEPNLRQIHLIHAELHEELNSKGFRVKAGDMGENITTRGLNRLPVYRRM
jgi:MOSC domain-containing protein YiiM